MCVYFFSFSFLNVQQASTSTAQHRRQLLIIFCANCALAGFHCYNLANCETFYFGWLNFFLDSSSSMQIIWASVEFFILRALAHFHYFFMCIIYILMTNHLEGICPMKINPSTSSLGWGSGTTDQLFEAAHLLGAVCIIWIKKIEFVLLANWFFFLLSIVVNSDREWLELGGLDEWKREEKCFVVFF